MVPFGITQRLLASSGAGRLQVLAGRRLMVRVADALARREQCEALVTGDSLGQVASQTLRNLEVVEAAATLPLLRPLIDRDKSEIIDEAQRLGTFETSILPDEDCCTLLMPGRAVTWTDPEPLIELERRVDVETVVEQLLEQALEMWPRLEAPQSAAELAPVAVAQQPAQAASESDPTARPCSSRPWGTSFEHPVGVRHARDGERVERRSERRHPRAAVSVGGDHRARRGSDQPQRGGAHHLAVHPGDRPRVDLRHAAEGELVLERLPAGIGPPERALGMGDHDREAPRPQLVGGLRVGVIETLERRLQEQPPPARRALAIVSSARCSRRETISCASSPPHSTRIGIRPAASFPSTSRTRSGSELTSVTNWGCTCGVVTIVRVPSAAAAAARSTLSSIDDGPSSIPGSR